MGHLSIAIHEAGHAVVAQHLGFDVKYATVVPEENRLGIAVYAHTGDLQSQLKAAFAGPAAQAKWDAKEDFIDAVTSHEGSDFRSAVAILKKMGFSEGNIGKGIRFARTLAAEEVEKRWPDIQLVAFELAKQEAIGGPRIREILAGRSKSQAAGAATLLPLLNARPATREYLNKSQFVPSTVRSADRMIDCIWYTGIDVPRIDWSTGEEYIRRFDPKGCDLSKLNDNAAVLNNHQMETSADQVGVVRHAWIDGSNYKATLQFSRRPEVAGLFTDLADGILSKFSMGAEILQDETLPVKTGQTPVRVARKWVPFELSVCPIPADWGTTTLSRESKGSGKSQVQIHAEHEIRRREIELLRLQ